LGYPTSDSGVEKSGVVSAVIDPTKVAPVDEDLLLVERFLAGDRSAFEVLYTRYYEKVFAIARGVLMDSDEAADAVQEIFTLVFRHLSRFDRRSRFSTWLFRVAVNRSIQESRRLRHKSRNVELTETSAQMDAPEPDAPDPRVHWAMQKLSAADRALLTLFYWEELTLQEIGDTIGCGVNAAKTRLYRARERFREHYERAPFPEAAR
jgi:RNA polymerase sigma-70 factor (ECF subfamily)